MKHFILLMALLVLPAHALAEIYKWVDQQGQVHFSDQKPEGQAVSEVQPAPEITSYQSVSYGTTKTRSSKGNRNMKVVMFSTSWCGYCKKAKTYFKKNGIRFTDYDIEKSAKGKKLYARMGATGVPVILVGDERMNGFSEAGFKRLYK